MTSPDQIIQIAYAAIAEAQTLGDSIRYFAISEEVERVLSEGVIFRSAADKPIRLLGYPCFTTSKLTGISILARTDPPSEEPRGILSGGGGP